MKLRPTSSSGCSSTAGMYWFMSSMISGVSSISPTVVVSKVYFAIFLSS